MPYGIYENGEIIAQFVVPLTVKSNVPVFASDSLSLKRDVTRRSAQRWEIETKLEPLTGGAQDLFVHMVTNGSWTNISVVMPQNIGVIKRRTSKSSPTASGTSGATTVAVLNNVGIIPKGTFIRFGNHSKIYMATSELNGEGNINIFPALRLGLTDTSFTHRDDVLMSCKYDTDVVQGMMFEDGILMDNGTIKLIESV